MLNGFGIRMYRRAIVVSVLAGVSGLGGRAMGEGALVPVDDATMTRITQRVNSAFALAASEVSPVNVVREANAVHVELTFDGRVQKMTLTPVAARAPGYRLIVQQADGK